MISQPDSAVERGARNESVAHPLRRIVHDFNNLLAAIHGYGALLLEDLPEGSTEKSFATQIVAAAESAKALVVELAEFSRLQKIKQDLVSSKAGQEVGVPSSAPGAQARPDKVRVLVVDDEAAIAELVARMLTRAGYEVDWFSNPLDALEAARNAPNAWQVAVSDQSMPDMAGSEFAAQLYALNPALPIILCTGHDAADIGQLTSAVSQILVKPVSREQLHGAVETALKGRPAG